MESVKFANYRNSKETGLFRVKHFAEKRLILGRIVRLSGDTNSVFTECRMTPATRFPLLPTIFSRSTLVIPFLSLVHVVFDLLLVRLRLAVLLSWFFVTPYVYEGLGDVHCLRDLDEYLQ